MKSVLRNDRGMSMVEVLMALGFTGILAAVLINLSEQQSKQHKKALVDSETIEVFGQFNRVISRAESCNATFTGLQEGDSLSEFRYDFDENADPFAATRRAFRGTKLILVSMQILKPNADGLYESFPVSETVSDKDGDGYYETPEVIKSEKSVPLTPPRKFQKGVAMLEVVLQKPTGVLGGKLLTKYFEVPASIGLGSLAYGADAQATIVACVGTPADADKCIASFDTFECAPSGQEETAMIPHKTDLMGYCFDKTPTTDEQSYILHCTTAK